MFHGSGRWSGLQPLDRRARPGRTASLLALEAEQLDGRIDLWHQLLAQRHQESLLQLQDRGILALQQAAGGGGGRPPCMRPENREG